MIAETKLLKLYNEDKNSVRQISYLLNISENTVYYWMDKYGIKRRSISDAIYLIHNPDGNPFKFRTDLSSDELFLKGVGLGLYWGEGNKANKYSVRLGNTNPELLKTFVKFLKVIYCINPSRLHYGLQIFTDIDVNEALNYWAKQMNANENQFYKPTITISGSMGNYTKKSEYGVLTVYYHNKKLRDIIVGQLPK